MKFWHNLRKKAYFVDVLLLIAAFIAVMGLANFVRLHATKTRNEKLKEGITSMNAKHMDTLSPENSNGGGNAEVKTDNSSASYRLQNAGGAPEAPSPANACSKDCDNITLETPVNEVPDAITPGMDKPCQGLVNNAINSMQKNSVECPEN